MKVTTEQNYEITVKAILRDEDFSLSMSATAPYGNRTVTVSIDEFSDKTKESIRKVLQSVMDEKLDEVVGSARVAASEAHVIAARRGEMS